MKAISIWLVHTQNNLDRNTNVITADTNDNLWNKAYVVCSAFAAVNNSWLLTLTGVGEGRGSVTGQCVYEPYSLSSMCTCLRTSVSKWVFVCAVLAFSIMFWKAYLHGTVKCVSEQRTITRENVVTTFVANLSTWSS